jgi:acyl carrier protein
MKDEIRKYIIDTFMYGEGDLSDEEPLFDSGILDSLSLIKLLTFIEKNFNVAIDMSDITMEKFASINEIEATIREKKLS